MPANEFEKQVQQKMDELQLRPSGQVWEEVEKRIRKEKKRRIIFFWLPLLALLLVGGGITVLVMTTKRADKTSISEHNEKQTTTANDERGLTDKKQSEQTNSNKDNKIKETTKQEETVTPVTDKPAPAVVNNGQKTATGDVNAIIEVKKPAIKQRKTRDDLVENKAEVTIKKPLVVVTKPVEKKEEQKAEILNNAIVKTDVTESAIQKGIDSNTVAVIEKKQETIPEIKKLAEENKKAETVKKNAKKNKWELGITFLAGKSGKAEDISLLGNEKRADVATPGGGIGTGAPFQSAYMPAEPKSGFAWQAGAYAKRKLSARTGVSAGLNFTSFSTTQKIGLIVNTGTTSIISNNSYSSYVDQYYSNGSAHTYTNHYYYLQLPVAFYWQINKGNKLPIVWQNGFSAGILTGSNALIYSPGSNVFYRDNDLLHKVQLSYQSGVSAKLFNNSKHPLTAGVLFNYHVSKLQKTNSGSGNRLASFGVQLGWILKK